MLDLKVLLAFFVILGSTLPFAYAQQPILITVSDDMDKLILDGKWTHTAEWKKSSLDEYHYGNHTIILRSAHQENFLYILLDFVTDINLDDGKDFAKICFDATKNNTTTGNNYCITATLSKESDLQKGEIVNENLTYKTIQKPENLIAIGASSDEADRYSKIPHSSYEFKIPTDLITRSDNYNFYFGVYDFNSNFTYTYPPGIAINNSSNIPNPSVWGKIISPDKSLPEFHFPFIAMLSSIGLVIYFVKRFNKKNE